MNGLISILLTTAAILGFFPAVGYRFQIYYGLFILMGVVCFKLRSKIHPIAAWSFFYFLGISFVYLSCPMYFWEGMQPNIVASLEDLITESTLYLSAIVAFILIAGEDVDFFSLFAFLGITDAILMIARRLLGYQPFFFFNNPAVDAAFISCCFPLILDKLEVIKNRYLLLTGYLLIPIALLLTDTSTGILGLGASISLYFWAKSGFKERIMIFAGIGGLLIAGLGFFLQGKILLDSSGRYGVWRITYQFWRDHLNHWIGAGLGTYFLYGPSIQVTNEINQGHTNQWLPGFFWAHQENWQILFELGIIGFVLANATVFTAIWKHKKNAALFSSLITYYLIAQTQMPLRHVVFALLGAWLVHQSLCRKSYNDA